MSVGFRYVARHVGGPIVSPLSVRKMLVGSSGKATLHAVSTKFSLMTYNMALLVFPGNYLGTDREGAIKQIIAEIGSRKPDVVGLCEVYADGEREDIRLQLASLYPFFQEGPEEADLDSDGGLLVLSRHPLLTTHHIVYQDHAGDDSWADKGAIHIRVRPPNSPTAYDIFYSHMQSMSEDGGKTALYAQLNTLHALMINPFSDPSIPAIVMGDLNIPGEQPKHHAQLLDRLGSPVDYWTVAGNPSASGFTHVRDNNFYEDVEDRPSHDERLDYILMRKGSMFVPLLERIEVLKCTRDGRFISDHFGLYAQVNSLLTVTP